MEAVRCGTCGAEFSEKSVDFKKISHDRYECKHCKRMLRPSTTAPTLPRAPIEDQSGRVKQLEAEVSALSEKLRQQAMESLKRINEKETDFAKYRSASDAELAKLKADLTEASEKARQGQSAMAQSAAELQYLQSSYKEMQEQMSKQKDKTMAANAKIKELSLRMEFAAEKQVVDAAPPAGVVTYAALDIDGAATLWRRNPTEMASVLPLFLNAVRATARQYKGFEMKNASSYFLYVFPSSVAAVNFAIALQRAVMNIKYPGDFLSLDPKLLGVEEVKGKTIYKGFRIAVGLHTTNGQYETDPVSGWVSPVGDAPLYMEKILPMAYGGQILASASVVTDMQKSAVIASLVDLHKDLGNVNVIVGDGMGQTTVSEIRAKAFSDRHFPALLTEAELLARKSESIASEVNDLKAENETLKGQLKMLEAKAQEANRKAAELQKFLAENQEQSRKTQREALQRYQAEMNALVASSEDTRKALDEAQAKNADLNAYLGELNTQLREVSVKAKGLHKQVQLLEKQHAPCATTVADLNTQLNEAADTIARLEEELRRVPTGSETPWGPLKKKQGSSLLTKLQSARSSDNVQGSLS